MEEFISVVIPMYNSEKTILKTLNSVIIQSSLGNINEIIIVNDGSTDNSSKIVDHFIKKHPNINIILIYQQNQGVSCARNKGISLSKSKWIALLDSDDEWEPRKIEHQLAILNKFPNIDFLGGAHERKPLYILNKKIIQLYKVKPIDICIKSFPQPSTVIFKRKIFEEIGGFDINQKYAEDANYFVKVSYGFNMFYDSKQICFYGNGKRGFGQSGLSANLRAMYLGNIKNLNDFRNLKIINFGSYIFLNTFYFLKFIRRIFLSMVFSFILKR